MSLRGKTFGTVSFAGNDSTTKQVGNAITIPTYGDARLEYITASVMTAPSTAADPTASVVLIFESPILSGDQEYLVSDQERLQVIPMPMLIPGGSTITCKARLANTRGAAATIVDVAVAIVYDQAGIGG